MNTINNDVLLEHVNKTIRLSIEAKTFFYETHSRKLIDAAKILSEAITNQGKILIFGNGGSAADAQHMAAEMTGRMLLERKIHLPALALTTDTSALTAIANDYTYDDIFDFQLKAFGRKGDVAIAISTSGNSKNVLQAAESAKKIGMKVISFTGKTGGKLKTLSDINLNVEKALNASMTQETHITVVHLLVDLIDQFLLPESFVVRK